MTAISDFYDPVRFILGDHDAANFEYEDGSIANGIRYMVRSGEVPGYSIVGVSADGISPDISSTLDYRLLTLLTARAFVSSAPDSKTSKVRPHTWSVGGYRNFLTQLDEWIVHARNGGPNTGARFGGWSNFLSWLEGQSGVESVWMHMTRLKLEAPFETVTLSTGGVSASVSSSDSDYL